MTIRMLATAAACVGLGGALARDDDKKSGVLNEHFDASVRPQDDLFAHVNGTWLKVSEIPADKSTFGTIMELRESAEKNSRAIIDEAAENETDADAKKIADLYASFMDDQRADELGLAPIQGELDAIAAMKSDEDVIRQVAALQRTGVQGPFGAFVAPDAKKSDRNIVYLNQGGLGLPDESYYRDAKCEALRKAYVDHVGRMLALAKTHAPDKAARRIMAMEIAIAKGHWDNVASRDATKTYNKLALAKLRDSAPNLHLDAWFVAMGVKDAQEVVVRQPSFFAELSQTFLRFTLDDWKSYLTWRVLNGRAPLLSEPFVKENFAFFGKTLHETPNIEPRWKRGVGMVESALGEALGRLYVDKHFPAEAKARMQQLVANLIEAYRIDIQALDWMSPETKTRALAKLAKFAPKIGYPEKWRDYATLEIKRDDLVGNARRSAEFALRYQLNKLGKPVDKVEWNMTPQTVNAYYSAVRNEIVFPAAILQPPFFNLTADDAVNYGGIGAVIGHEIGHGFDDQGSKYDGDGNLSNWWSFEDRKEFEKRANMLIEQYAAFQPRQLRGQHVNGKLTVGENIGDLGGVMIAYKAYLLSLKGKQSPTVDGLTGPQRFFIGWAQVWRGKYRDAAMARMLATNPHSPPEFRCNGVVRNLAEFYEAFGVKEGDKLWLPEKDRVRIW